jgi:hypothetical protein
MKYRLIIFASIFLVIVAWVKINHETFPAPPDNFTVQSKTVNLKFKISNMDLNSVELALNEGSGANNYFCVFELSDGWKTGNFGMVLKDMSESSLLKGNSGRKPDISRFEKSNNGEKINFYSFDQTLVKDDKGLTYVQMCYAGAAMPLIQSLKIEKPIRLPRHIAARFVNNGNIEFQAGSFGLDSKINGFWIPVKIL